MDFVAISRTQFGLRIAESRQLCDIKSGIAFWRAVGILHAIVLSGRKNHVSETKGGTKMKLSKIVLIAFALCQIACGDDEATEAGSELQTTVEFELTGSEGYALTSAAIFIEPCLFDAEGQSEVLVLTPWEIDCDGPKIGQAPDNWKAVTITLEDVAAMTRP